MDLKFKDNSKLKLAPFTQLEYIESTGTQWIDTGINLTDNIIVKTKGVSINFGIVSQGSANGLWFGILQHINNTGVGFCGTNVNLVTINNFYTTEHYYELKYKSYFKMDDIILKEGTWNPPLVNKSMLLFQAYDINAGKAEQRDGCKIHYFIIEQDDVEILHLIAALDYNNTPCMYDTISETFFYNQGTGSFIAGPIVPGLPKNIVLKTTTLYHKNTPNVDGLQLLSGILNAQETAEDVVLNRIRVDIGNVSGSISELMQYASMAGFNDAGEEQAKPRLVGTWTINDWYTQEQLTAAQDAFDGLTVVGDNNYLIDFSQMAVQVLDDTQPNYNPAVAIILQAAGYGNTLSEPPISGQTGRWFITKTQAALVANNIFSNKNNLTDANGIVTSDTTAQYTFTSFNEAIYFNIPNLATFNNDGYLINLHLPESVTNFNVNGLSISVSTKRTIYIETKSDNITPGQIGDSRRYFTFSNSDDRFIMCGYKDKYKGKQLCEVWYGKLKSPKMGAFKWTIRSYFDFCSPKISYDGTHVSIAVERDSDIYYTLDGTIPTKSSTRYTESFLWDGLGVVKAMAIDETNLIGDIAYSEDFYASSVDNPTITINNNVLTINSETDSTVYYTLDGTSPTLESQVYTEPIILTNDTKIRCFATKNNKRDSEFVSKYHIIDDSSFNDFAIQCLDNTKPNYNPSACVCLDFCGCLTHNLYDNGGGYITKTEASTTEVYGIFNRISVNDHCKLLSGETLTLTTLNEFRYFTNVQQMTQYTLYPNTASLGGATQITTVTFPETVTTFQTYAFGRYHVYNLVHILTPTVITLGANNFFKSNKIYVGDGSSAAHDDAILADYLADSNWAAYSSELDTWYNYLHPTT